MNRTLLVLRPEPGASETAERAEAMGLSVIKAPLFVVSPLDWDAPDPTGYDAVLITSANAPRHGGGPLGRLSDLPCFAVGEASAETARAAGFRDVTAGPCDGAAVMALMASAGVRKALHLCGRDHVALSHEAVSLERRAVYAADPVAELPQAARDALAGEALVILHSPRAAARLAELVRERAGIRLAAISRATAEAAGEGWAFKAVARRPREEALLELAARLCNYGRETSEGSAGADG